MSKSAFATALVTAAVTAAGYWADGVTLGRLVIGPAIIGLAIFFQTRGVAGGLLKTAMAIVYLGCIALASVAVHLLNKVTGSASSDAMLQNPSELAGVLLAWMTCSISLRQPAGMNPTDVSAFTPMTAPAPPEA